MSQSQKTVFNSSSLIRNEKNENVEKKFVGTSADSTDDLLVVEITDKAQLQELYRLLTLKAAQTLMELKQLVQNANNVGDKPETIYEEEEEKEEDQVKYGEVMIDSSKADRDNRVWKRGKELFEFSAFRISPPQIKGEDQYKTAVRTVFTTSGVPKCKKMKLVHIAPRKESFETCRRACFEQMDRLDSCRDYDRVECLICAEGWVNKRGEGRKCEKKDKLSQ